MQPPPASMKEIVGSKTAGVLVGLNKKTAQAVGYYLLKKEKGKEKKKIIRECGKQGNGE